MADNFATLAVQSNLNVVATQRALEAMQQGNGWSLPCKVIALNPTDPATGVALGYSFVQVQFEANFPYMQQDGTMATYTLPPIILPKAESQWIRASTQVGDFGITVSADTFHGGVSGLGSGVANVGVDYGNLTRLLFVPIGNANFGAIPDPNKPWINGPAGAQMSDTAQQATHVIAAPAGTPGTITSTVKNPSNSTTAITHTIDGINNRIRSALASAQGAITHVLDGINNKIQHSVQSAVGAVTATIDGLNNRIQHSVANALGPLTHTIDGEANAITHSVQSAVGAIYTIVDGNGRAISHVVPTGATLGLGAPASSMTTATNAALNISHLSTFQTNLLSKRLDDLTKFAAAMVSAGVPNAGAVLGLLASLVAVPLPSPSGKVLVSS